MGADSPERQHSDDLQEVTTDRVSSNGDQNGASVRSSTASSSSSRPEGEDQSSAAAGGGTFPKPANFAEKIMHVLENNMEPEAIRWIDNGEAIAIHPENAKQSKLLAKFFQMKSFPIFTRTLIRWYVCVPAFRSLYSFFGQPFAALLTHIQYTSCWKIYIVDS